MSTRRFVAIVIVVAACSKSPPSDMQLICEAIERSGSTAIADPAERAAHTAKWMAEHVHDKHLLRQLEMNGDNKQKAELVRMVARENGYTDPCPIADAIESSPSARPAPAAAAPEAAVVR